MGVIYKLREEVVHFIVGQRQDNPLASCRQLAESASQKFNLHLSKSSVHDVLKEAGIITPRGRKPKDKFEIPQEKKKQIQASLSQVKLLPDPAEEPQQAAFPNEKELSPPNEKELSFPNAFVGNPDTQATDPRLKHSGVPEEMAQEISSEYEGAGKVFLKAALWDLGIFSEENIKAADKGYYLTYSKGIKVFLEDNKSFFIDLPLPLERCIRETADGLINNIRPFIVHKVSDDALFKASMEAKTGFKIDKISIVDEKDHILLEFNSIVELKRNYFFKNMIFVVSNEIDAVKRAKSVFFSQHVGNDNLMENIMNLRGFATTNKQKNAVTILIENSYDNKNMLQEAAEKLNGMYLRDEQDRLVKVKIQTVILSEAKDLKVPKDSSANASE